MPTLLGNKATKVPKTYVRRLHPGIKTVARGRMLSQGGLASDLVLQVGNLHRVSRHLLLHARDEAMPDRCPARGRTVDSDCAWLPRLCPARRLRARAPVPNPLPTLCQRLRGAKVQERYALKQLRSLVLRHGLPFRDRREHDGRPQRQSARRRQGCKRGERGNHC